MTRLLMSERVPDAGRLDPARATNFVGGVCRRDADEDGGGRAVAATVGRLRCAGIAHLPSPSRRGAGAGV